MNIFLPIRLALRDWLHERTLSLCAVLALASMLTPLLVLHGVKVGLVESLRTRLLQDPTVLIITPSGSGVSGYTQENIEEFQKRTDVRFAVARTRDIAAELQFEGADGSYAAVTLEPTAQGDPLLTHHNMPIPTDELPVSGMVLSAQAARKLNAETGKTLTGNLGRKRPDGVLESVKLPFKVVGILPPEASPHTVAFMPLSALEDIQDYRDYVAVPRRGYSGDPMAEHARRYESFRLYAKDLDAVESLDAHLASRGIEAITKAKQIADIRKLGDALNRVIIVIALAVALGFTAFTVSSALAAVRRKDKMLGTLRLLGFSRASLLVYPLTQSLLTGVCGTVTASLFSYGVAAGIDMLFSEQLLAASVCVLKIEHLFIALCAVLVLSLLASLKPALRAARIDPSLVIRDV